MSEEIKEIPLKERIEKILESGWVNEFNYLENQLQEARSLVVILQQKVEQLENIRKEVIEYIKDNACYSEGHCKCSFSQIALDNLLNILNKGENNE